MAIAYSNGEIHVSGSVSSLALLSGLAPVSVSTLAPTLGDYPGITQYVVNTATPFFIDLGATFLYDPSKEHLVLLYNGAGRCMTVNGTFNYGSSAPFQGGTIYQPGCGLTIGGHYKNNQRQYRDTEAGIYVSGTGELNWKGATIFSGRSIISDGALNIENGKFVPRCTDTAIKDYCPRVGFKKGTGSLNGLTVEGGAGHFFGVTLGEATLSQFRGLNVVGNNDLAAVIAPEPGDASGFASQFLLVSDIQDLSVGSENVSRAWQGRFIEFLNYAGGVNLRDQLSDKTNTEGNAKGAVLATKQVSASFATSDGTPIQGAKFYVTEASDGNEPPASVNTAFTAGDISYLESPQSFLLTADVSGETPTANLAIYFGYKMTATNPMIDNVRTLNGGNTVQAGWYSYLHQIGTKEVLVSGQNEATEAITLVRDLSVTEASEATALAYTTQETTARAYDHLKALLGSAYAGQGETYVSRTGTLLDAGSYNVVIDGTGSGQATIVGNTITINASTFTGDMLTTGTITLANGATFNGTYTDANGTYVPPNVATVSGIVAGSRLQIYNVTTQTEIFNDFVAGTSYTATYPEGTGYTAGDVVRVRLAYINGTTAKLPFTAQAVAGASGWTVLADQVDDPIYIENGVDGELVAKFSPDFDNDEIDVAVNADFTMAEAYAFFVSTMTYEDGIREWFGAIVAEDIANYRVEVSVISMFLDNVTTSLVRETTGARIYRSDGIPPVRAPNTTGGGYVDVNYRNPVLVSVITTADSVVSGSLSDVPGYVQTALTAQGYTTDRAGKLDRLDATVSSRASRNDVETVNENLKEFSLQLSPVERDLP